MLQRKQSVYFLFAAICAALLLFLPAFEIGITKMKMTEDINWMVATIALIVFPTAGVLLFKHRPLQLRLGYGTIGLVFVLIFLVLFDLREELKLLSPTIGSALPILILVFAFLGIKGVKSDEKLIRDADRLR
jgi:peptidoglycan/LPS O-acetylase OafA/YrhL